MCYQSIKPIFIENLERHETPEATAFDSYYDQLQNKVEVISTLALSTDVNSVDALPDAGGIAALVLYPQPISLSVSTQAQVAVTLSRSMPNVTLRLVDVIGREVGRWQLGRRDAGHHTVTLPLHRLTAGSYIAVLESGRTRKTMPVTVLP